MSTQVEYITVCDVPDCAAKHKHTSMEYFFGKHICIHHFDLLKPETKDALRESHEGGTRYFGKAKADFNHTWSTAMAEIRSAEAARAKATK